MKLDQRALMVGAFVIALLVVWSAQQGGRPACPGGSCCPLPLGLGLMPSKSWVAAGPTNGKPGLTASEAVTNRQQ